MNSVILGEGSRMCTGLKIRLLKPVFPRHHEKKWPVKVENPDAQMDSLNYWSEYIYTEEMETTPVHNWAVKCMDGIFKRFMQTFPLLDPPTARA